MDLAERMAKTHWETRSAIHHEKGMAGLGKWEDRTPQAQAYLIEAMRRTLEAHGLIEPEQLGLFQ